MTNLTARADHIRDRLAHHWLAEVAVAASPMTIENWALAAHALGPHARFGLGWPMDFDDPTLVVPFCPEIVDQVTCEMSDDELDEYLGVVEFLADSQIGYLCDGLTRPEALERAERDLLEEGPGSLARFTDAQLAALDRGIGS